MNQTAVTHRLPGPMIFGRGQALLTLALTVAVVIGDPPPSKAQCPPVYVLTGAAAEDKFGTSVAAVGDIDGDGFPDFMVGAYLCDSGGLNAGCATVYSGLTGEVIYTFTGDVIEERLGIGVAGAGDVNNDGTPDLLVGASGPTLEPGHVHVYSGETGSLLHTVTGEGTGDWFGHAVAGLGDIDEDGFDDFVVGAHYNDSVAINAGRAYVYSGAAATPLFTFSGEATTDWFGWTVAAAGDVDGDSIGDIIIGAPHNDAGGTDAGRAYVFSGADGDTIHVFTGFAEHDQFGGAVAGAGDVNNDGFADLIVGTIFNATENLTGRAFVFSGQDGTLLYTLVGEDDNDEFSHAVAAMPDVDGDSVPDLVIGSRYGGDVQAGRAYVHSGASGGAFLRAFSGTFSSDFHGLAVAGSEDLNNDGWPNVIVGSPGNDLSGENAGAVFVYSFSTDGDGDGIDSGCDNCPYAFNPLQEDADGNGIGDICECPCTCHGNPQCDGGVDVLDVVQAVSVAFRNDPPLGDPNPLCPRVTTDVDCNGQTDVLDVVKFVNVGFRNQDPGVQFCDPCAP